MFATIEYKAYLTYAEGMCQVRKYCKIWHTIETTTNEITDFGFEPIKEEKGENRMSLEERVEKLEEKVEELEAQVCALIEGDEEEEGEEGEDDLVADEEESD